MSTASELETVYYASYRRLVIQLYAVCGDLSDAEDAVQEAFVKASGQGRSFERVSNPEAWLRTTAINHQRNSWRHGTVVRRFLGSLPSRDHSPEPSADHVAIVAALGKVDRDQREVLVLHYLADLSVAQIAHELGIPEGTVKSRLARGRERMAPLLGEREESDHV